MKLMGTQESIKDAIAYLYPDVHRAVKRAYGATTRCKGEMSDFQAYALYALAQPFDAEDQHILEIGTAYGFSAVLMALAAPQARITTLNPQVHEVEAARASMTGLRIDKRVSVVETTSQAFLETLDDEQYSMIFVDGDHVNVRDDFAYWPRLCTGGLMLFHDYAPEGSWRACQPVYEALEERRRAFRGFDVMIIDDKDVGMVGWYKQKGERWF